MKLNWCFRNLTTIKTYALCPAPQYDLRGENTQVVPGECPTRPLLCRVHNTALMEFNRRCEILPAVEAAPLMVFTVQALLSLRLEPSQQSRLTTSIVTKSGGKEKARE